MKSIKLGILCSALAGLVACSDDNGNKDAGPGDFTIGEAGFVDGFGKLYECSNPGGSCEAHNACVLTAVCGSDRFCHPVKVQNCNDNLDCTQDICRGNGVCDNVPKTDTCALPVKVEKDGKTITELQCFQKGDKNPTDPCLVCVPGGRDGGSQNQWGLANGGACDDKNLCTKNDYCQAGVCKGEDYRKECEDAYGCTDDICDGKGGCGTDHPLKANACLIDKKCYSDGEQDATTGCNVCDVKKSQSAWTPLTPSCNISGKCQKEGAKDPTSCLTCDPVKNPTAWTPIPGLCKIDNVCYKAGDKHSQGCAECDPALNASAWSVKVSDKCLINNTCYNAAAKDSTGCATCDPAASKTTWTTVSNMCKIGSSCYAAGALHTGKCATCDPATSATAWTVTGDNCLINNTCYLPAAKDSTGCGTCDPPKSKTDWSPVANTCKINNKCYTTGQKDPTGCAECDPAISATAWTVKSNACLIGTTCHQPGATNTTGCGTCDPTKSKTDWSPVANKCLIGTNCYANLSKDTTGCLVCDVAKNPSGWTPVAGVTSVITTFEDGKNPPTGWTINNSDTKVGWVVSNRKAGQGSYALYYGDPAVGNFDTSGVDNYGTADMPPVAITAGKKAGLSFMLYMDTESGTSYDALTVKANGTTIWTKPSTLTMKTWQEITVDLSAYAGQSVVIQFHFDTGDDYMNTTEGTFVDAITIYHNC